MIKLSIISVFISLEVMGCTKNEFAPEAYVKSTLDAVYHDEYEEYAKFLDISEKEAKSNLEQDFEEQIQLEFENFDGIKKDGIKQYQEMMRKVKELAKYEVAGSKKDDDGSYIVEVRVEPADIYQTLEQSSMEVSAEKIEQGLDSSEPEVFAAVLAESIRKSIEQNTYGKAVTVEVTVSKNNSNTYYLEDTEMEKLAAALFSK